MDQVQLIVMTAFLAAGGFTFLRVVALARAAEVNRTRREAERAARAAEQARLQAAREAKKAESQRQALKPRKR